MQSRSSDDPFNVKNEGTNYKITPLYDYHLRGLVVSQRDLDDDFFNTYFANDPINKKDLCVIWGENARLNRHLGGTYSSDIWTCHVSFPHSTEQKFWPNQLSNNHILPADEDIAKTLDSVEIGDEVQIFGQLVNYDINGMSARKTSTTRSDLGNGACEVLYVTDLKITKQANTFYRSLRDTFKILFFIFLILKIVHYFKSPVDAAV